MKNKILSAFIPLLLLISYDISAQEKGDKKIVYERSNVYVDDPLPNNLVPNKQTAIKIAEAVWLPIYGKKIYNEKPFTAELTSSGIWIVKGTLKDLDLGAKGGVAYIEIQKSDCKILKIYHGK
ncbi:YbbC/YhhH family protein [uncultured Flavobacterium sp.]|uniref:YbbC/YhhH family protein n=1 Tax=uncultured Flavobacterium sp. TaxID=165435 RepID=UPI00292D5DFC|nr:YbbC/YhhH family protein [uncultured Flavobacterium sp.]